MQKRSDHSNFNPDLLRSYTHTNEDPTSNPPVIVQGPQQPSGQDPQQPSGSDNSSDATLQTDNDDS